MERTKEKEKKQKGRPPGWTKADAKPMTVKQREYHKKHYEERKRLEGVETQRAAAEKMQEAYIRNVQADYLYYCDYVHNHNRAADDLRWYPSRFHKYICRKAQEFVDRETEKAFEILIISTPPQHGKSESVTATLPSWYVMRNPEKHVIQVSYGDDLSRKFGLANLNKVKEFGEIFGVEVDPNRKAAVNFGLKGHQGGVKSAGYGAGITGNPADLIIIDDPVKNMAEADSARDREKKWDDFEASIKSRLSAHGKIILIMTRWHEDDLAGRLIEHYKDFVEVINLPCEAEEHDVLGRSPGDALCPEIGKDNVWLESFKKNHMSEAGLRSWNALYQGRPTAMEGNLLKREWWQYYDRKDYLEGRLKFDTMMMSVDCAFKDAATSDYTAIEVWGKHDNRMYLVDLVNDHLDAMATVNTILLLSARYAELRLILVEDKANGPAVMQLLRDKIMGVVGVTPDGSKEQRVNAVSYYVEAGNVFLPNDCGFTFEFVDQCAAFPNGKHDDMVDAFSMALNRLAYNRIMKREIRRANNPFKIMPGSRSGKKFGRGERINVI